MASRPPPTAAEQMRAAPAGGRRKVALAPGHSHLDWMRLTASLPRYQGPTQHTRAEVATHRRKGDAWTVIRGRVYDVSRYIDYHPGGAAMLLSGAGKVRLTWSSLVPAHWGGVVGQCGWAEWLGGVVGQSG